jgi:hypothetical protein
MTLLVQSPVLHGSEAIELSGGTWRKRLLPVGTVDYKGRTLRFDRDYLEDLAKSFRSGAYDQVPFQLADAANTHTNDPERFRGEITGMDVADDGLYVTVRTTDAGNALLTANPRLGVSARIVEDYGRSDGRHFEAAIQHVLGTLDPRIPALGEWEPVDFSNRASRVIDLSAEQWNGEPGPGLAPREQARLEGLLDLPDDEWDAFINALRYDEDYHASDGAEEPMTEEELAALAGDLSDEELAELEAEYIRSGAAAYDVASGSQLANSLSAIELAQATAAARAAEDAAPRSSSAEVRLATALGRIGRGTYVPRGALDFAAPTRRSEALLGMLGYQGGLYGGCSCGAVDSNGQTASRYHLAGCSQAVTPEDTAEMIRSGAYASVAAEAATDAHGRAWRDQFGQDMTYSDHLEALTGQRLSHRDGPFGGLGHRELAQPQRVTRFGDRDDPDDPGAPLSAASQRAVRALAGAMGLPDHAAARQQARDAAHDRMGRLPAQRYRSYGERMDYGESARDRSARMRQGVTASDLVQVGEPWNGAQPVFTSPREAW